MDKNGQKHKKHQEEQLQWCKQQDFILGEIEIRLRKMKIIAEYSLGIELTTAEIKELYDQMNVLKREVLSLEKQQHSVVH